MIRYFAIAALCWGIVAALPGCTAKNDSQQGVGPSGPTVDVARIQKDMAPLDLSNDAVAPASIANYFDYYGINGSGARHFFGYFTSLSRRISAHVFIPHTPEKGTLFLLHGYLDHSGTLQPLIDAALSRGLAVAACDLPGHGLSSGERAAIDDFSEYVKTLEDFVALCSPRLPGPYFLAGHSTGCAIAFEYLQHKEETIFEKVVFLAPLVRNAHWHLSKLGIAVGRLFRKTIPRKQRDNSSDAQFLAFVRNDPLQGKRLSIKFLDALHAWEKRVRRYPPVTGSVLLIQGTGDAIVDWQYNLAFLRERIKGVTVELIDDAKHQLVNESETIRNRVFDTLFDYLDRRIIYWDRPDIAMMKVRD
jgi:alpha-beta hydrolase superfamily lysophospholipase